MIVVLDAVETDYEYEGSDNEEEKLYKGEPRWVEAYVHCNMMWTFVIL